MIENPFQIILDRIADLDAKIDSIINLKVRVSGKLNGNSPDEFLSADQVAAILKIKKSTLYTLTSKRKIPFMKRGKRLHFSKSQISVWLYKGKKKTISEIKENI